MRRAETHIELSAGATAMEESYPQHFDKVALLNMTCLTLESVKVQVCWQVVWMKNSRISTVPGNCWVPRPFAFHGHILIVCLYVFGLPSENPTGCQDIWNQRVTCSGNPPFS